MYGKQNSRPQTKCWVKWGRSGKKYFFTCGNILSRQRAIAKAKAQQGAIFSSGWTG